MERKELEEKIKNNKTVYVVTCNDTFVEIKLNNILWKVDNECLLKKFEDGVELRCSDLNNIYATKEEAQFYLDCGNVTRIEHLPFVTWEEFLKGKEMKCYDKNGNFLSLFYLDRQAFVFHHNNDSDLIDLTEEDYYKTYKICKDLFLGKENNVDEI